MIGNKNHYVIAGATGLIGSSLLEMLLASEKVGKVTMLTRRLIDRDHPKLVQKEIDFETFTESEFPKNADATFCCLGTTMKAAGSKDVFRRVDYEYVVKLAVFSQRSGIAQYHVVSAAGADPNSKIFYNKVKGRMETEVKKLNQLKSTYFYRPSMLLGNRDEFRLGEAIGKAFMKTFSFLIPKSYQAIYDAQVAYCMHHFAENPRKGSHVISNKEMLKLAQ